MRVAVLQLAARFAKPDAAFARVESLAASEPADLFVLPEASLTGYVSPRGDFDLSRFAEPREGPAAQRLAALAKRTRAYVAGPLIERDGDAFYNAFAVFDRAGERVVHYRKRHPWLPETWASPGEAPHPLFEIDGVKTTLAVCFDLHFLEDEARDALETAALLLFPSAWVEEGDSRASFLSVLAARHRVAIVNANWAAGDVRIGGQGHSIVVDESGALLGRAGAGEERLDVAVR